MEITGLDKYTRLKRRIYLFIFPILFVTNASYWLFSPYLDRFMELVLPPGCLFLAVIWLLIYYQRYIRACEIVSLIAFGLYHLFRVSSMPVELGQGSINVYMLWSTIYFIYIFMVLERKRALAFALFIFAITIAMGIPHFDGARVNDTLIQYYFSTLVYIIVLFFFQSIVSSYIDSDTLSKSAHFDALTDIGNRRSIDLWLEREIKQSVNSANAFSVIYFDIDQFKEINDEHGHDIGDHVLKEFTGLVQSHLEPHDLFGRWGGDEFIIILKDHSLLDATQLAEKLRNAIQSHRFRYVNHITSSFGVTSYKPGDTAKTLVKRADQALYIAKNSGKNTVQIL